MLDPELFKGILTKLGFEKIDTKPLREGFITHAEKEHYTAIIAIYNEKITSLSTNYHPDDENVSIALTPSSIIMNIKLKDPKTDLFLIKYFKTDREIIIENVENFIDQFTKNPIDIAKQLIITLWEA